MISGFYIIPNYPLPQLSAAVGFCEGEAAVQSANVVGYSNAATESEDNTMVCGSFCQVDKGDTNVVRLTELSVTGYPTPEYSTTKYSWQGGLKAGQFIVMVLSATGIPTAQYSWVDYKSGSKNSPVQHGPCWAKWDDASSSYVNMTAEEAAAVDFPAGTAFWTKGLGYKLQSAGRVEMKDIEIVTRAEDNTAVGNCAPMEIDLGSMSVTGYPTPEYSTTKYSWQGGLKAGQFIMMTLSPTGLPTEQYSWVDYKSGSKTSPVQHGPCWAKWDDATSSYVNLTAAEMAEIKFPAGKGFWIKGLGYSLVIPGPEIK